MDATLELVIIKNKKGFALVYIALLMVAFCAFLGLAVDMGYMYVVKGQLQNASDSAALAGASKLSDVGTAQPQARAEAKDFAYENLSAAQNGRISSDGSNVITDNNDITVGNWNHFRDPQYLETGTPVNAVKVRSRRTSQSAGGAVNLFFSSFIGRSQMEASAVAVAARSPRAGFYFILGNNVCNSTGFPLVLSPAPGISNMAWSSLMQPATSASYLKDTFMCPADKLPDQEVCGASIYMTNGSDSTVFQSVETDFYDPGYDKINKTFGVDKKNNRVVSTWTVIVPVSAANDPTTQSAPQVVWGYARMRMIRACSSGVGNACNAANRLFTAPNGVCKGGENDIVIDQVTCVTCANSSYMLGVRPNLVQ